MVSIFPKWIYKAKEPLGQDQLPVTILARRISTPVVCPGVRLVREPNARVVAEEFKSICLLKVHLQITLSQSLSGRGRVLFELSIKIKLKPNCELVPLKIAVVKYPSNQSVLKCSEFAQIPADPCQEGCPRSR